MALELRIAATVLKKPLRWFCFGLLLCLLTACHTRSAKVQSPRYPDDYVYLTAMNDTDRQKVMLVLASLSKANFDFGADSNLGVTVLTVRKDQVKAAAEFLKQNPELDALLLSHADGTRGGAELPK